MRDSVYRINLDVHTAGAQVQLVAKRGDVARRIYMTLYEDGKPWAHALDGMTRAVLTVLTPEGHTLINDCDIRADGTVIFDFTVFTVAELGIDECELTVYDSEDNILTSPRFTILVDDTVFETGQTVGAAWQDAIERAKEQIKETTDALQNKTRGMPLTFDTVEAMQAEDLPEGQITKTRGRWLPNDGGAREYKIVSPENAMIEPVGDESGKTEGSPILHPLAIELENGLYALPILTDRVTFFDIGLKRGKIDGGADLNMRESDYELTFDALTDKIDKQLLYNYMWRDDSIPAENSRLLQNYLDHIPAMATAPGVCSHLLYASLTGESMTVDDIREYEGRTDLYAKAATFSRIFVPAGTWFFRDPVVIEYPIKMTGAAPTAASRHNTRAESRAHPVSGLFYPARELTVVNMRGESVSHFAPADPAGDYAIVPSQTPGETAVDLTVDPPVKQKVYVDHAMFYVACRGASFTDLEFLTVQAFSKGDKSALCGSNNAYRPSGTKGNYRPGDDAHDTALIGAKFNQYHTTRTKCGVNGVICSRPKRDADGRILVDANGRVVYDASVKHGITQSETEYAQFERCMFEGFSGRGLVMGSLSRVNNCRFYLNYIGIESDGHDCWINWTYVDEGFVAIKTNSHTTYLGNCYLNMMEGYAVVSDFRINKRGPKTEQSRREGTGDIPRHTETYWVTDDIRLLGTLTGKFDADVLACSMGAYGCNRIAENVVISGRIGNCGTLYDMEHTVVSDQKDFGSLFNYNQAKDAVDGGRDSAKAWDAAAESWTKTPEEGDQTLAQYSASADGVKYMAMYVRHKTAHIPLLSTSRNFYRNRFPGDASDDDRGGAIVPEDELDELILQKLDEWRINGTLPHEMVNPEGTEGEYTIDDYGDENRAAALAAVIEDLDESEQLANDARSKNLRMLIGASAISVGICNGLNVLAPLLPRRSDAMKYAYQENGVTKYAQRSHLYPLFGVSCYSLYNSFISFSSQNYRHTFAEDHFLFPGGATARMNANRMRPVIAQGYNYALVRSVTPPFSETSTAFYSVQNASGATDSAKYLRFFVKTKQTASGNVSVFIKGYVSTEADTAQASTTPMPSTAEGAADLQSPLPALEYGPHYTGFEQSVFSAPLIATSDYAPGGTVVSKKGDVVGTLILDFETGIITVCGKETYKGAFADISLGGAM